MSSIFFALATLKSRLEEADKERGATAVEYGLLVALIAAVIVGIVVTLGQDVLTGFTTVTNALP
ncbi:Flp family type IVb pilin [uncultured Serinicoccus sp.]|uniref:Flp family type IVb pilin n=1 Tax=uncultured Serinicoccus sp. TaxID=735514 RepID=UPI00260CA0A0|nr:Flp family type IVb pilin [uncultured Serinicoccus sp.]